jgi:hypothetical protein
MAMKDIDLPAPQGLKPAPERDQLASEPEMIVHCSILP